MSSSPGPTGDDGWFDSVELPPCTLGPEQQPNLSCRYIANGRCYDAQSSACACICDPNRLTTCVGRFVSETSVELTCD